MAGSGWGHAREVGFFYADGHGVSRALNEQGLVVARAFFNLPEVDKLAVAMVNSPHFRGCTRAGGEFTRHHADLIAAPPTSPEGVP